MKTDLALALLFCLIAPACSGREGAVEHLSAEQPATLSQIKVEMGYRSDGCSFRHSPVNFCDERHLSLMAEAIAHRKPDFHRRYILLTIPEWPADRQSSVVAIDPTLPAAYPVPIDAFSGPVGKSGDPTTQGKLMYALDNNEVCIDGAILAYKAIKNGRFCFTFQAERFTGYKTAYME